MPFQTTTKLPIAVPPDVDAFERASHLPAINGSESQIAWARLIRHQFLAKAFETLLERTATMSDAARSDMYKRLDTVRAETRSKVWIERHRDFKADPVTYLGIYLPEIEAEERKLAEELRQKKIERQRKAVEQRQLLRTAVAFETEHVLPDLDGSPSQESFGRRCRYLVLSARNPANWDDRQRTEASYWIAEQLRPQRKPLLSNVPTEAGIVKKMKT